MGAKTKIDWADSTWNPVTGCLHGCEYCYARKQAKRFEGYDWQGGITTNNPLRRAELNEPLTITRSNGKTVAAPYPFGFEPTFHRYKLDEPAHWKKPRNVFVGSMCDLFGIWVPDEWLDEVIKATQRATHHHYLFLTKNPERIGEWLSRFTSGKVKGIECVKNCLFGASATTNEQLIQAYYSEAEWISIEPIHEEIDEQYFAEGIYEEVGRWKWVVIGAETGNSKNKIIPKKEWIDNIVEICEELEIPVFMKNSIRGLMGEDFRQEYPWNRC